MPVNGNGVYIAVNRTTNDFYIGATSKPASREYDHRYHLEAGKKGSLDLSGNPIVHQNYKFQDSFNKDSEFNFLFFPTDTADAAFEIEKTLIEIGRKEPHCLNLRDGTYASFMGKSHTDETKKKMSDSAKIVWENEERHLRHSQHMSEFWNQLPENKKQEIQQKKADSYKQTYWNSPELQKAKRESAVAQFSDPESRKAISDKRLSWFSNGGIAPQTGKPLTEEQKERMQNGRSTWIKGLTEQQKQDHYQKVSEALSIAKNSTIYINDVPYANRKEAAVALNVSPVTISKRIKNPNRPDYVLKPNP